MHVVPRAEIGTAPSSETQHQLHPSTMGEVVRPTSQRNNIGLSGGYLDGKQERLGLTWQEVLDRAEAHN